MKTKTFDCVQMQHEGGRRIRELTKGMTLREQVEFWRKGTEQLLQLQRRLRENAPAGGKT